MSCLHANKLVYVSKVIVTLKVILKSIPLPLPTSIVRVRYSPLGTAKFAYDYGLSWCRVSPDDSVIILSYSPPPPLLTLLHPLVYTTKGVRDDETGSNMHILSHHTLCAKSRLLSCNVKRTES